MSENGVLSSVVVAGDGPPLLVLHGGPGLNDYMGMIDAELQGWRSIRYQQRGLAPSALTGPFDVGQHVADAISVLDSERLDQTVVLGHSWGGHLALQVALAVPDRVSALVLVDPMGSTGDGGLAAMSAELTARLSGPVRARVAELGERLEGPEPTADDALEHLALVWPSYFADPASAPAMPADVRISVECNSEGMTSALSGIQDGSFGAKLAAVDVPVVIVLGERSAIPLDAGRATAGLLPRAEVVVVPASGHFPWIEQPGCVSAALSQVREALATSGA